jgi:hypothetical protein
VPVLVWPKGDLEKALGSEQQPVLVWLLLQVLEREQGREREREWTAAILER